MCVREREGGRYATAACVRLCAEARGKVSGCRVHLTKLLSTKSNETLWTGHEKTVTVQWDSTVGKKGKAHYVAQIAFFDDQKNPCFTTIYLALISGSVGQETSLSAAVWRFYQTV